MPQLPASERRDRDALVASMVLAGVPYRKIGERVGLSPAGVHRAVKRGMAAGADRRADLFDQAWDTYVERSESLWAAFYPSAMRGDVKAAEVCRRLLAQMGDLYGLVARGRDRLPVESRPVVPGGPASLQEWRENRLKREA